MVALSLAGAMLLSDVVKLLVSRPRPPVEHLQAVTGSSFPSGHATQASAFWFSLVLALSAAGVAPLVTRVAAGLALALVLAVALSRIYLGVHYPGDVLAGVLLGTGWAVFVARCMREAPVGELKPSRTLGAGRSRHPQVSACVAASGPPRRAVLAAILVPQGMAYADLLETLDREHFYPTLEAVLRRSDQATARWIVWGDPDACRRAISLPSSHSPSSSTAAASASPNWPAVRVSCRAAC